MSTTQPPPRPVPSPDRAVVRLRSPGDLLAALPYHLGYVPERSLVVLTLRGRSLFFVGRVDLPPRSTPGREAASALLVPMSRHRFDRALVVTVEDALLADPDPDGGPGARGGAAPRSWTDLAREVCAGLRARGVEVDERITVRDGLWWCPDGTARERRPQRLPGAGDVPALAEYVVRGRAPLRHRDDLAALVRSAPESSRVADEVDDLVGRFARAGSDRRSLRRAAVAAWSRFVAQEPDPTSARPGGTALRPATVTGGGTGTDTGTGDPDLPLLLASLHDVRLRDLVLGWLCPDDTAAADPQDPELAELARELGSGAGLEQDDGHLGAALTRLGRACPRGRGAPVLAVLGHVAWWRGDGTLARVAVDAALEQDPGYRLALLLGQLLDIAAAPAHVA